MQILVNSNHSITGTEALSERVEGMVEGAIGRFAGRITRVEVHLNDVNGAKHGATDKRCMLEARVGGLKPIAVTHQDENMREAVNGAAEKLERALAHALERLDETAGRKPQDTEIASVATLEQLQPAEPRKRQQD
ncbi:MAG TPA: HPF/RaiA family ribosome-associated protein [Steroidobacteraceae bacterium]|nr:HPF/RaiA family ribosome-associated protein [Steroidobacteraceae bacterium]